MRRDFSWTDEANERARAYRADGTTATKAALLLSGEFGGHLTRNAVIGKWHLENLPAVKRQPAVPKPKPNPLRRVFPMQKPISMPKPPQALIADIIPPTCEPIGILDLRNKTCRWPFTHHEDATVYCGDPSADLGEGRPYCPHHAQMAYAPTPGRTRRRSAA